MFNSLPTLEKRLLRSHLLRIWRIPLFGSSPRTVCILPPWLIRCNLRALLRRTWFFRCGRCGLLHGANFLLGLLFKTGFGHQTAFFAVDGPTAVFAPFASKVRNRQPTYCLNVISHFACGMIFSSGSARSTSIPQLG